MKKGFLLTLSVIFFAATHLYSQCGKNTPVFNVDLSGSADTSWTSTSVARNDTCCGTANCVEFIVKINPGTSAIRLDIASGAMPTGALYYQVGCNGATSIGQPLCLSGVGPHKITFCKPGNNSNTYKLTTISKPRAPNDLVAAEGCSALLKATGYDDSSVRWHSISGSAYDSYLSCASGCSETYVKATYPFPPYVDYVVCGLPLNACSGSTVCDTVRVYFVSKLKVAISPGNPVICFGNNSIKLKANPSGGFKPFHYTWSTASQDSEITAQAGTCWVKIEDSTHCSIAYDTIVVRTETGAPYLSAGNDTMVCKPGVLTLKGTAQNLIGVKWIGPGRFFPSDTIPTPVYTPTSTELAAGKTTLKLLGFSIGNCFNQTKSLQITFADKPAPVITGNISTCIQAKETYTCPLNLGDSITWSATGGTIIRGPDPSKITVLWMAAGTNYIFASVVNQYKCATDTQLKVAVYPRPAPAITGRDTVCLSGAYTYITPLVSNHTYKWSVTNGSITSDASSNSVTVVWNTLGSGTLKLIETSQYGCDSTAIKAITIIDIPKPVIAGTKLVCHYDTGVVYMVNNYSPLRTYKWLASNGIIQGSNTGQQVRINWQKEGSGVLTLETSNRYGCSSAATYVVTIAGKPNPSIIGDDSTCERRVKNYSVHDTSAVIYQWYAKGGYLLDESDKATLRIFWQNSGIGQIQVLAKNSAGCDTTVYRDVHKNPRPIPYIQGKDSVCELSSHTYGVTYTPGHKYHWTIINGSPATGDTSYQIDVNWKKTGKGILILKETNAFGCDTTVAAQIIILPNPSPVITGSETACQNQGEYTYTAKPNSGSIYSWTAPEGIILAQKDNEATIKWLNEDEGMVTVKETNKRGCSGYDTLHVTVKKLVTSILSSDHYPCNPAYLKFSVQSSDTLERVYWDFGDGTHQQGTRNSVHLYTKPGKYTVSAISTSVNECQDSTATILLIRENPKADFNFLFKGAEQAIYVNEDTLHLSNISKDAVDYVWDFGDGSTSSEWEPEHVYTLPGDYIVKLKVHNDFGCVDSIEKTLPVKAHDKLFIPNCFTPNQDNKNEYFKIFSFNLVKLDFVIYNRWGERIYQTNDLNFQWDGTFRGVPVPMDVYEFILRGYTIDGEKIFRKGYINVIR
jgi:gliding motility-associated-like protein